MISIINEVAEEQSDLRRFDMSKFAGTTWYFADAVTQVAAAWLCLFISLLRITRSGEFRLYVVGIAEENDDQGLPVFTPGVARR